MLYRRLSTAPVVIIAKVAGRVRGAGNEFILACDMCFASRERAVFGQMEAGLGLLPGGGCMQHLKSALDLNVYPDARPLADLACLSRFAQ
jgi:enoyl-CoA hydratase/carnithine racemase